MTISHQMPTSKKTRVLLSESVLATQNQATSTPPTRPDRTLAVTAAIPGQPPEPAILNVHLTTDSKYTRCAKNNIVRTIYIHRIYKAIQLVTVLSIFSYYELLLFPLAFVVSTTGHKCNSMHCTGCNGIIEISTKARRHVVGILNVNKHEGQLKKKSEQKILCHAKHSLGHFVGGAVSRRSS